MLCNPVTFGEVRISCRSRSNDATRAKMVDIGDRLWSWKPKYWQVMVKARWQVKSWLRSGTTAGPGVMMIGSLDVFFFAGFGLHKLYNEVETLSWFGTATHLHFILILHIPHLRNLFDQVWNAHLSFGLITQSDWNKWILSKKKNFTGTSRNPNEQQKKVHVKFCVWVCGMYISARGHGCVFAWERPSEWESQALLGLTAASWCCSRKSCWTC